MLTSWLGDRDILDLALFSCLDLEGCLELDELGINEGPGPKAPAPLSLIQKFLSLYNRKRSQAGNLP